jgi:flagellar biosynthesis/type III secretory pathway chaperone
MVEYADPFDALLAELALEELHVAQMQRLLEDEQADLVAGRTERLEAIAAEKLVQLRALELYGRRCEALLAKLGYATTRAGLAACAVAAGGTRGGKLHDAWSRLAAAAAHARDMNEENGALITMRLAHVGGRLAHLDGAGAHGTLYSAAGHFAGPGAGRSIGRF